MTKFSNSDEAGRWLERELDGQGIPRSLPTTEWLETLLGLQAIGPLDEWPESQRARLLGFLQALLRRTRPDSGVFFGPTPDRKLAMASLTLLMKWGGDPSFAKVLSLWNPKSKDSDTTALPPLPTDLRLDLACSVLRPSWSRQGDWLAIDHRGKSASSFVELGVGGRTIIGPSWDFETAAPLSKPPTVTFAKSSAYADGVEWTFRSGRGLVTRSAVLLRTRKIAILAQQNEAGASMRSTAFQVQGPLTRSDSSEVRSWTFRQPQGRPTVRLIPLISGEQAESSRAEVETGPGEFRIRSSAEGRRQWLGMLACWERPPSLVRVLTVSEKSKVCASDRAFAVRLAWGRYDEGLVIYRSLAKPELRTFLGHQTQARFIVGRFTTAGQVIPLLTME